MHMNQPIIELYNASVAFGPESTRTEVLKQVNLKVMPNEFVAIIGFSGSGKSTLINLLSGLLTPDEGATLFKGKESTEPGPERGVMFQNYSLLPWLTVYGNIEMAVKQVFPHLKHQALQDHVMRYVQMVNLTPAIHKRPRELSGGMRQRVSLARTLAIQPDVMLLDEPLSALDALTRSKLQEEIIRIWSEDRKTVILITNDVDEALLMADRIVPLSPGPGATLLPGFDVPLARPRDRTTLNHDPAYKSLRNEITRYMAHLNLESRSTRRGVKPQMPNIRPLDLTAA